MLMKTTEKSTMWTDDDGDSASSVGDANEIEDSAPNTAAGLPVPLLGNTRALEFNVDRGGNHVSIGRLPSSWSRSLRVSKTALRALFDYGKDSARLASTLTKAVVTPTGSGVTISQVRIPRRPDIFPVSQLMEQDDATGYISAEWLTYRQSPSPQTPTPPSGNTLPTSSQDAFPFGTTGSYFSANPVSDQKVILYFHGGVFHFGSTHSHRTLTWKVAKETACTILSINYRLAPKYMFPLALHDALSSYLYLIDPACETSKFTRVPIFEKNDKKGEKDDLDDMPTSPRLRAHSASKKVDSSTIYRYRPENIVLCGDSAGANLIVSLMLWIRHHGCAYSIPMPAGSACMSLWCDLTHSTPSFILNGDTDFLPPAASDPKYVRPNRHHYYAFDDWLADPLVSPLFADVDDDDLELPIATARVARKWLVDGAISLDSAPRTHRRGSIAQPSTFDYGPRRQPLPPILLQVGSMERLYHENLAFVHRTLSRSPSPFRLEVYHDMPHSFQVFFFEALSAVALERLGRFVQEVTRDSGASNNPQTPALSNAQIPGTPLPGSKRDSGSRYVRHYLHFPNRAGAPPLPIHPSDIDSILDYGNESMRQLMSKAQSVGGLSIGGVRILADGRKVYGVPGLDRAQSEETNLPPKSPKISSNNGLRLQRVVSNPGGSKNFAPLSPVEAPAGRKRSDSEGQSSFFTVLRGSRAGKGGDGSVPDESFADSSLTFFGGESLQDVVDSVYPTPGASPAAQAIRRSDDSGRLFRHLSQRSRTARGRSVEVLSTYTLPNTLELPSLQPPRNLVESSSVPVSECADLFTGFQNAPSRNSVLYQATGGTNPNIYIPSRRRESMNGIMVIQPDDESPQHNNDVLSVNISGTLMTPTSSVLVESPLETPERSPPKGHKGSHSLNPPPRNPQIVRMPATAVTHCVPPVRLGQAFNLALGHDDDLRNVRQGDAWNLYTTMQMFAPFSSRRAAVEDDPVIDDYEDDQTTFW
ncbi:hypothetical protein BJ742DRAFT_871938 [Cladochytrium replicatum]|nr:hypothetical protein BJ742DRAFT_871938 [Cladochytrium replicatum]